MKKTLFTLIGICLLNAQLSAADSGIPVPDDIRPEKPLFIFPNPAHPDEHFSFEEAVNICEQYKNKKKRSEYFYIFCRINWDEKDKGVNEVVDRPIWINYGTEETDIDSPVWGYFRHSTKPLLKKTFDFDVELVRLRHLKIVSVAVWGVGKISELKNRVLFPSTVVEDSESSQEYESEGTARLACLEIRNERRENFEIYGTQYEGSKCKVQKHGNGKQVYWTISIVTKDPLSGAPYEKDLRVREEKKQ